MFKWFLYCFQIFQRSAWSVPSISVAVLGLPHMACLRTSYMFCWLEVSWFETLLRKALSFIVNFEYTTFFQNHSLIFVDNLTHSFLTLAVHLCVTGCRETDSSKRIVTTAGSAHKIGLHILHIRNTTVSYHVACNLVTRKALELLLGSI